ncbi:hypothetical protein VTN49DRAFT_1799 [Thermomyces lanuginosus]|uniref:uncharacterized protein n=1 Tax=Thermomyces lanuginosus TaxID=5541 RepID=UPI003744178C
MENPDRVSHSQLSWLLCTSLKVMTDQFKQQPNRTMLKNCERHKEYPRRKKLRIPEVALVMFPVLIQVLR